MSKGFNRRDFVRLASVGVLSALAGCQAPTPTPTAAPAKPAAAPTAAPEPAKPTAAAAAAQPTTAPSPTTAPATVATPAPKAAAKPAIGGKVTMMFWDGPPLIDIRKREMEKFKAKIPQVQFELVAVPGGYYSGYADKLATMIAGGIPPDTFIIPDSDLPHYLTKNLALNIGDYVKRDSYDLNQFPKAAIENYRYKGGLYGLPDNITSIGLFYNETLFKEAGLKLPATELDDKAWNWDAYLDAAKKMTKSSGGRTQVYGLSLNTSTIGWVPWVWANGGEFTNKDVSELMIHQDPAVEAIQYLVDLRFKHGVAPRPESMADTSNPELFKTGRIAMLDDCVCRIADYRTIKTFKWEGGFRPAGKAGRVDYMYAYPLLIAAGTKNPDGAWEALKFFEDQAMPEIVKAGGLQGTKMEQMRKYMRDPQMPPQNVEPYIISIEKIGRPLPLMLSYREIEQTIRKAMDTLWLGQEKDVRKVVTELKAKVDPMLKAARFEK